MTILRYFIHIYIAIFLLTVGCAHIQPIHIAGTAMIGLWMANGGIKSTNNNDSTGTTVTTISAEGWCWGGAGALQLLQNTELVSTTQCLQDKKFSFPISSTGKYTVQTIPNEDFRFTPESSEFNVPHLKDLTVSIAHFYATKKNTTGLAVRISGAGSQLGRITARIEQNGSVVTGFNLAFNDQGIALLTGLPVGSYEVAFFLDGTRVSEVTDVAVTNGVVAVVTQEFSTLGGPTASSAPTPTPDTVLPKVTDTGPSNNATGVSPNTTISVTFDEPMNPAAVTTETILLTKESGGSVGKTVEYNSSTQVAKLTPTNALDTNTKYTVKVKGGEAGVKDAAGNPLSNDHSFSFTTGTVADTITPTVSITSPSANSTIITTNVTIQGTASDAGGLQKVELRIQRGNDNKYWKSSDLSWTATETWFDAIGTSTWSYAWEISPVSQEGIPYTIRARATDNSGNVTTTPAEVTGVKADTKPPSVPASSSVSPVDGATNVAVTSAVTANWSEALDSATVTTSTVRLTTGGNTIQGTVSYDAATKKITFTPSANLSFSTTYTMTLVGGSSGIKDLVGNVMTSDYTFSFTTAAEPDTTAPSSPAVTINSGATRTNSTTVTLSLSATDNTGVTGYYASESQTAPAADAPGWTPVTSSTDYSANVSFTISGGDGSKTVYVWFKDSSGNVSAGASDGITPDTVAPQMDSNNGFSPANNIVTVAVNTTVTVKFDDAMDTSTITTSTFTLSKDGTNVSGTVSFSPEQSGDTYTAIFTPSAVLSVGTKYTVTLTTGIKDIAGNALAQNATSAFVTAYSWSKTTVDSTGDVGRWPSLSLDSSNKTHISYYDMTKGDLKYATNSSGTWATSTVYSTGDVGKYTSLAYRNGYGDKMISYYDATNGNLNASYRAPEMTEWVRQEVDTNGDVGLYTAAGWSLGWMHIVYYDKTTMMLKHAMKTHDPAGGGPWNISDIEMIGADGGQEDLYTSMAIGTDEKVHIAYYHFTNGDLKYAVYDPKAISPSWQIASVDTNGDVGFHNSIVLDGNGKVHIAYRDTTNGDLKYATNASGQWVAEAAVSEGNITGGSIAVDTNGKVVIAYYNVDTNDLRIAGNALGVWRTESVDNSSLYIGTMASMKFDSNGKIHLAYYDGTNFDLIYNKEN